ncbi:MAG TPA: hypothetical protein VK335_04965, partial [Bryobacteraceae bacterium]|nr:hypothetical protein [Bryobacteraceae bacterium]
VVGWHPLLHRHVAEHPALLFLVSAHSDKTLPILSWLHTNWLFQQFPRSNELQGSVVSIPNVEHRPEEYPFCIVNATVEENVTDRNACPTSCN